MDGLVEPLRGWVKGFNPITLTEAIKKERDMSRSSSSSSRSYAHSKPPLIPKERDNRSLPKRPLLDEDTRRELRRKKLCFNCMEPWEPRHHCLGKGKIHYIEVMSKDEEEEYVPKAAEEEQPAGQEVNLNRSERIATLLKRGESIVALTRTMRCTIFQVWGTLQG